MSEIDSKLDAILDIESDIKEKTAVVKLPDRTENVETDYRYARENLYNLVERGQDAIDGILELSKETEHPRAYEVAGQLIKNVADTADKLIDLQKKMKELDADEKKSGPSTVNNTMFIGSTAELQKMLKKQKEINNTDTN